MGWRDWLFSFGKVKSTEIGTLKRGIGVRMEFLEGNTDDEPEESGLEPMLGPPGFFCRPKPPVAAAAATGCNPEGHCEVVGARVGDEVVPLGFQDLRLNALVNPKEGELGLVGYNGGFISLKDNDNANGTNIMIYALRRTAGGVADKASCISIDSTSGAQAICITHELGQSIMLTKDGDIMLVAKNGSNWIQVGDAQGVVLSADKLALAGGVMLGDKDPATGDFVALAALVLSELGKIATALNGHTHTAPAGGGATTAPIGAPIYTASSVAATMAKAK
jgi:hypothetical protein